MLELLYESLRGVNLPATALLLIVLFYWVVSLVGLFDLDMFDSDADTGDADVEGNGGFWHAAAEFFHFGDVPVTIIVSFFALFFWMGTVLTNHYLGNSSILLALIIYLPNILLGAFLTKLIVKPLSVLYIKLKQDEEGHSGDFSGMVCTVVIGAEDGHMGQGEINLSGDSYRVNIRCAREKNLKKGSQVLLIEYNPENGTYLAEPYNNSILHD